MKVPSKTIVVNIGFSGDRITLPLDTTTTILNVKQEIERKAGIPASQQRIIFDGKQLEDDAAVLHDLGVVSGSRLYQVLRLRGC